MRKLFLIVLTGLALMLAAPQFARATPLGATGGLGAAAGEIGGPQQVWYRYRTYRYRYRPVYRYRYRYVRCWHRRYWSGRRCW